ncbi:F-box/RNI-like superfamily protein, partial [Prunus dulcis]
MHNILSFTKGGCLPAFDNLSELKLVLHDCYHWDLLTELLKRSPNLEYLVVEHKETYHVLGITKSTKTTRNMSYTQSIDGESQNLCLETPFVDHKMDRFADGIYRELK